MAALLALAMLSYASIRSAVMQAVMAAGDASSPAAADMTGMSMAGMSMEGRGAEASTALQGRNAAHRHGHGHKAACPYCAAAAHAPTMTVVSPLRACVAFVFTAFRVAASRGPRGPPAVQPRARGPPAVHPLTA